MIHWKFFMDANSLEKAQRIASAATEKLSITVDDLKIEPYHKGGFVCSFLSRSNSILWPELVLDTLKNAQSIGRNWLINGDINNELDLWSNDSSIVGIRNISLFISTNYNKALKHHDE